jgi:hypothetical protein
VRYDPMDAPDSAEWLAASEADRLDAVLRNHKRTKKRAGNLRAHAAFHVIVETQLAEGLGGTVRALARLREQGLDRHDAIHAVGSVLAEQFHAAFRHRAFDSSQYEARLDALTADVWRSSGEDS